MASQHHAIEYNPSMAGMLADPLTGLSINTPMVELIAAKQSVQRALNAPSIDQRRIDVLENAREVLNGWLNRYPRQTDAPAADPLPVHGSTITQTPMEPFTGDKPSEVFTMEPATPVKQVWCIDGTDGNTYQIGNKSPLWSMGGAWVYTVSQGWTPNAMSQREAELKEQRPVFTPVGDAWLAWMPCSDHEAEGYTKTADLQSGQSVYVIPKSTESILSLASKLKSAAGKTLLLLDRMRVERESMPVNVTKLQKLEREYEHLAKWSDSLKAELGRRRWEAARAKAENDTAERVKGSPSHDPTDEGPIEEPKPTGKPFDAFGRPDVHRKPGDSRFQRDIRRLWDARTMPPEPMSYGEAIVKVMEAIAAVPANWRMDKNDNGFCFDVDLPANPSKYMADDD